MKKKKTFFKFLKVPKKKKPTVCLFSSNSHLRPATLMELTHIANANSCKSAGNETLFLLLLNTLVYSLL